MELMPCMYTTCRLHAVGSVQCRIRWLAGRNQGYGFPGPRDIALLLMWNGVRPCAKANCSEYLSILKSLGSAQGKQSGDLEFCWDLNTHMGSDAET